MAYQTGNATTVEDLLAKLATFAQSVDGWVVDKIDTKTLYVHNDKCFWSFYINKSNNLPILSIAINNGFDSNLRWNTQPNSSSANGKTNFYKYFSGAETNFHQEPFYSYTFLATAQYIHVVVRVDSRRFRHFGIGTLIQEGHYDGGHYAYGTYSENTNDSAKGYYPFCSRASLGGYPDSGYDHLDIIRVGEKDYYFGAIGSTPSEPRNPGLAAMGLGNAMSVPFNGWISARPRTVHPDALLVEASLSNFNNLITLVPQSIYLFLATKQYQRIGVVPDFYVARIDSVIPGTIQEINGEKFYCCAATTFQSVTGQVKDQDNSYDLGYFYRVIE